MMRRAARDPTEGAGTWFHDGAGGGGAIDLSQ